MRRSSSSRFDVFYVCRKNWCRSKALIKQNAEDSRQVPVLAVRSDHRGQIVTRNKQEQAF